MNNKKDNKGRPFRKGEGQRKDGMYVFTYRDNNGKQAKAYSWTLLPSDRTPRNKKKGECLRDKEERIIQDLNAGLIVAGKKQRVYDLCKEYVKTKINISRDNTIAAYNTSLNIINEHDFGNMQIGTVTKTHAKNFLIELQTVDGFSFSAIQNVRGVLRPAFETAVEDGYVRYNPFDFELKTVIRNETQKREALNDDELQMFLNWVKNNEHYKAYYDMFFLQFHTGLRVSELCGLTISDIVFDAHYISVERQLMRTRHGKWYIEAPKTRSGVRKVPITPEVEACLRHIIENRPVFVKEPVVSTLGKTNIQTASGFLFFDKNKNPVIAQTVENHYRYASARFKKEVAEATTKCISSHVARHTYCSLRVKEGMRPVTLQKIMGHNSIRTTLGWYTHVEECDVISEALELMKKDESVMKYEQ